MARKSTRSTVSTDTPAEVTPAPAPADTDTDTAAPVAAEPTPADTDSTDTAAPADSTDSTGDSTDTPEPTPADPADTFAEAFRAALTDTDPTTGTVPEVHVKGTVEAFRAIPARKRDGALLAAQTEATAAAMADGPAAVKVHLLTGSAALVEACRTAGTAPAAPKVTPADRFASLALAALALSAEVDGTSDTVAPLSVWLSNVRGADPAALVAVVSRDTDPEGAEDLTPEVLRARAALKASAGKRSGGTSGGKRSGAAGGARGSAIADHIRAALEASGEPMKVSALVKALTDTYPDEASRPSSGAVSGALKKGTVPGVVAVTVDGAQGAALEG